MEQRRRSNRSDDEYLLVPWKEVKEKAKASVFVWNGKERSHRGSDKYLFLSATRKKRCAVMHDLALTPHHLSRDDQWWWLQGTFNNLNLRCSRWQPSHRLWVGTTNPHSGTHQFHTQEGTQEEELHDHHGPRSSLIGLAFTYVQVYIKGCEEAITLES